MARGPLDWDDDGYYDDYRRERFTGGGVIVWGAFLFALVLVVLEVVRRFA